MLWEGHNNSNVISERAETQILDKIRCSHACQYAGTENCPINTEQTTSKYLWFQTVAWQLLLFYMQGEIYKTCIRHSYHIFLFPSGALTSAFTLLNLLACRGWWVSQTAGLVWSGLCIRVPIPCYGWILPNAAQKSCIMQLWLHLSCSIRAIVSPNISIKKKKLNPFNV